MKLSDMIAQADNEDKLKKEMTKLRFKITNLDKEFQEVLYRYDAWVQSKIVEQKKYIKGYIEKYLIDNKFIITTNIVFGANLNLTAKYKDIVIELDNPSNNEIFQINCKNHEIYSCFSIEPIWSINQNVDANNDLYGYNLLEKYHKNIMNVDNSKDAQYLINYLEKNIDSYKKVLESTDKTSFRFKHYKENVYSDSIENIIKELFES